MIPIVVYSLKRKLLRPIVISNLILLPLLLILILGNALAATFADPDTGESAISQEKVGLAVVDEDGTKGSRSLVDMLSEEGSAFDISASPSFARAQQGLENGEYAVVLRIATGFESNQLVAKPAKVDLYAVDENIDALRASDIALKAFSDVTRAHLAVIDDTGHIAEAFVWTDYTEFVKSHKDEALDPSVGVSGITYYAVTMLVLMLIYGIANTMNFVTEEYVGPLGDRYLASPVDKTTLALSQVIAGVVLTILQALVIILVAKFAFGADYGASIPQFLVLVIIAAVFFNSIGLLLGMFARRLPSLDLIVTIAIPAMAFIGGGFVKLDLGGLQNFSINTIFQRVMFEQISGADVNWNPLVVCLAIGAAALIGSVFLLKRPEGR